MQPAEHSHTPLQDIIPPSILAALLSSAAEEGSRTVLVLDGCNVDLWEKLAAECQSLLQQADADTDTDTDTSLFTSAGMGGPTVTSGAPHGHSEHGSNASPSPSPSPSPAWRAPLLRGDRLCWVTPRLCRDRALEALPLVIRRTQAFCTHAAATPKALWNLNDMSVQFAIYVCICMYMYVCHCHGITELAMHVL
jgi:hypothetical protein